MRPQKEAFLWADKSLKNKKRICIGILAHVDAGKRPYPKGFFIFAEKYESWEEWIMEMPFWILMSWRGNGELLYFPSRRG